MKKILSVFDGYKLCKSTLDYAIQITQKNGDHLTGVFLDAFFYRNYNLSKILRTSANPEAEIKARDELDETQRNKSIQEFEKVCQQAHISFSIHRDNSIPLIELKYESMFADLIVINESEKFTRIDRHQPTSFMKDLLADVECPVIVVPDTFKEIKKIVFLYDGGPSSLYAIKMFSYLFENWQNIPVEVITVNETNLADMQLPGSILMTEFISRRFPKSDFRMLNGNAEQTIIAHLMGSADNQLIVLGAYRRSEFSRWLKQSMADILMIGLDRPLFIAHHQK